MSINFNFTGKVVLITGSSSGTGAQTAVEFARAGAHVVVTGRQAAKVSEVAKECLKVSPNQSKPLEVIADVTKPQDLRKLVDTTIGHFGKLDVLVNNAGAGVGDNIADKDFYEKYLKVMQINLNSVVYLTHLCVEHLAKTKGNVVNISSVGAMRAVQGLASLSMAKCAVDMFSTCMAAELGTKGIRVNVVNPGPIRTGLLTAMGTPEVIATQLWDAYGKVLPVGRAGMPQDMANAILFLASNHAAFITGANLIVDGGILAANAVNSDIIKNAL